MVVLVRAAVGLGELDPVAGDRIDGAEAGAVGAVNLHMGLDPAEVGHVSLLLLGGFAGSTWRTGIGCKGRLTVAPKGGSAAPVGGQEADSGSDNGAEQGPDERDRDRDHRAHRRRHRRPLRHRILEHGAYLR